ncbi:hypothetical protein N7462_011151 [Penicillium macrosclerotiorum]|uniref:uncharacterized protein n=1 Tax=Penicillium macrosclerotiorum TaxID=303699 RepID=UPI002549281A|nr:uncharacterized protein N7462_011151 [Penicillium macrosclerotiorum]KAJ5666742.1 hypothetical protein N7462_011151 [Penicillium macrosclerotiorum]
MADPLSITASIIAVIQLSTKVVKYVKEASDAIGHRNTLLLEMSATKGILDMLWDVEQGATSDEDTLTNTQILEQPLKNYAALLMRLEAALAPAKGLKKIGKTFKWPFEKAEMLDILAKMERYKSLFGLALHADHIELSRAVHRDLESLQNQQREEEMREIIRWLSPLDFEAKHQDIFARHQEGTGQWLLDDDRFVGWERGQSRILWCPGVPGAGKTVFASIALEHLRMSLKDNEDMAVIGIYCDYKEFNQQSTSKYLASLLQQLTIQCPSIPDQIKKAYAAHSKKGTSPSFPEYLDLLTRQMTLFKRTYIIVDALDECTEANGVRDELLEGILQLPTFTSVLVTSRHIPTIEEYFQDAVKLPIRAHEDDINLHVRSRLAKEKSWGRRIRLDSVLQTKIANSIVERASGIRKDVERALQNLPIGLKSTYNQIMQRIDDQGEDDATLAREVLSWLTYARRPFACLELQQALAIKDQDKTFEQDAMIHEDTLASVCAGLPVKDDMPGLYTYIADNWGHHARESPETPVLVEKIISFINNKKRLKDCIQHMSDSQFITTTKGSSLMSSLHIAAMFDLDMTMKRLLELDPSDVNTQDSQGRTPLYFGAAAEGGGVVNLLLDRSDVDIDLASYYHGSPLHSAIESKQEGVAKILLERGADPESKDAKGIRPIHKAIMLSLADTLRTLLNKKVDITSTTNSGHTPLELAMPQDSKLRQKTTTGLWRDREVSAHSADYPPCLQMLLESSTERTINEGEMLFQATKDGRPDIVEILLHKGARVSDQSKTFNQRTPLHWAAEKGFQTIVELLLRFKSNPDIQDQRGFTPLHYAVTAGREDVVKILVAKMEDLDIQANDGLTCYQCARIQGYDAITNILLQAGAKDDDHEEVPVVDIQQRHKNIITIRETGSTNPWAAARVQSGKFTTEEDYHLYKERFIIAAGQGDTDAVLLCLSKGVHVDERDHEHSKTALHWAAENGHKDILQLLLEWGSSISSQDQYGETALHYAAESGHTELVQALLKKDPDLTVKDDRGRTALPCARDNYHLESVQVILELWNGTNEETEEKDKQNKSLMHWAAELGDEKLCQQLWNLNPDPKTIAPDQRGWTAIKYAKYGGYSNLVSWFEGLQGSVTTTNDNP